MKLKFLVKISPAILALVVFSSCGQLKTPKKAPDLSGISQASVLSVQAMEDQCRQSSGVLTSDRKMCVTGQSIPLNSQTSSTVSDIIIDENFVAGKAITANGSVQNDSVKVMLNGSQVISIPQPSLVVVNGTGRLHYRVYPGSWSNVSVTVYTCYDSNMRRAFCPNGIRF